MKSQSQTNSPAFSLNKPDSAPIDPFASPATTTTATAANETTAWSNAFDQSTTQPFAAGNDPFANLTGPSGDSDAGAIFDSYDPFSNTVKTSAATFDDAWPAVAASSSNTKTVSNNNIASFEDAFGASSNNNDSNWAAFDNNGIKSR